MTEFHGNSSHTDHFKLLREDGTSVLVGARNIIYNLSLPDLVEYTDQVRYNSSNVKRWMRFSVFFVFPCQSIYLYSCIKLNEFVHCWRVFLQLKHWPDSHVFTINICWLSSSPTLGFTTNRLRFNITLLFRHLSPKLMVVFH